MKIRVLGAGTLRPHPDRGSPGFWVEAGVGRILMDCGSGTLRSLARFGVPWEGVTHLILSHFHTDHVGDVAPLLFALKHGTVPGRRDPLTVLGPPGTSNHFEALAVAHGSYVLDPGFPLEITELAPGKAWGTPRTPFRLESYSTNHAEPSMAYKLRDGSGIFGYTGDTGPDPDLGTFLFGCNLLVAECSFPDAMATTTHLTPSTLFDLASLARPELLMAVHVYPPLRPKKIPGLLVAKGYGGRVEVGRDGLVVSLEDGRVAVKRSDP